jgi:hypothetical protein
LERERPTGLIVMPRISIGSFKVSGIASAPAPTVDVAAAQIYRNFQSMS